MRGVHAPVRSRMLERDDELAGLEGALAAARAGAGRVYLISGDPGIGKTTLARSLVEVAEPTDVRVRWGKCWEEGGAPAYWPWKQVLRAQAAETDDRALARLMGAGPADVAQLVPEIGARLSIAEAPLSSGDALSARFRLFEAVSSFLRAASAEAPLLVVLEDLHAADEPSLSLLQFLARDLAASSLLVVGTYREAEVRSSPQRSRLLRAIAREGDHVLLGGLGVDSVRLLLRERLGDVPPEPLVREVRETTEGNPLFVREVAGLLASQRAGIGGRLPLPEAVQGVVQSRLGGLGGAQRDVLSVGSVMGRQFDVGPLSTVTGHEIAFVLDALGDAARVGAVEEVGLNRWSFTHALVRETLYDALPLGEQVRLHKLVAKAFEDLRPDAVAEIAHHRFQAARTGDDIELAVSACAAAAEEAAALLAFEEAESWYGRALEVLAMQPGRDERRRCELLCCLGGTRIRGGSRREGREAYREAYQIARLLESPELVARAALGLAGPVREDLGSDSIGASRRAVMEDAVAILPDEDSPLRARLLMALGHLLAWERLDEAHRHCRTAIDMARRLGEPETLAEVLWSWHLHLVDLPGTLEERLQIAGEIVDLVLSHGDKERVILARQWRIADRFEAADIVTARAELAIAVREAEELRLPFLLWNVTFPQATLALLEGRFDDAERLASEAYTLSTRTGFGIADYYFTNHLIFLRRQQGRFEEAEDLCRQAMDRYPLGDYSRVRGLLLADVGRLDEARALLHEHCSTGSSPEGPHALFWMACFAEICHVVGDGERASALYEALRPFAGSHVVYDVMNVSLGGVDRYLGLLATLLGRFADADAHFEAAHRLHERMGARPWGALGYADHGRMLRARGEPGDEARASTLLARARDQLKALGMSVHARCVTTLLERPRRTSLRHEGEEWLIEYEGATIRLRDSKGLRYLAHLLASPGQEVHALELSGGRPPDVADRTRRRLEDLQADIEDARAAHDLGRLERAEGEFDELMAQLQEATETPDAERARQSVTRALKGTIDRIGASHLALGQHLRTTIRTGVYSSYTPDARTPIQWDTSGSVA